MQLARAVAARALTDWAEPEEPAATAEPPSNNAPKAQSNTAPEPPTDPAPAAPRLRIAGPTLRAPSCKPVCPALLFTRLAATVRDCITLEARLTAGPARAPPARPADPRRAALHETFRYVTESGPDSAERLRDTTARLDQTLAADPNQTIAPPEIFATICEDLGLDIDLATLPDEYLDLITGPEITDDKDPRATSPP